MLKKLSCLIAALILSSPIFASSYNGTLQEVEAQASSSSTTRISIKTGSTTACGAGWYAFEYAANGAGPGANWFVQVQDAILLQRSVIIVGNGTCDSYNVEGISNIQSY